MLESSLISLVLGLISSRSLEALVVGLLVLLVLVLVLLLKVLTVS